MAPDSWRGLYEHTLAEVKAGTIPLARLDDAVRRILRVKLRLGLFEQGKPSAQPLAQRAGEVVGSPAHRALARRAVRESLVLLKNKGGLLPLDPRKRILVAGDGADNISKQNGGWTLTWQGTGLSQCRFPRRHLDLGRHPAAGRGGRWSRGAVAGRALHAQARRGHRGVRRGSLCRVPGRPAQPGLPSGRRPRPDPDPPPARAGHPGGGGVPHRPSAVGEPRDQCRRCLRGRLAAGQRRRGRRRRAAAYRATVPSRTISTASWPTPGRARRCSRRRTSGSPATIRSSPSATA